MGFPALQLFGCGIEGCTKPPIPADDDGGSSTTISPFSPEYTFFQNAMPLIEVADMSVYEAKAQKITTLSIGHEQRDSTNATQPRIGFDKYTFTVNADNEDVYAITSCYIHYIQGDQSNPTLMGGAQALNNEKLLILKPLPTDFSAKWLPGKVPGLLECVYLNVTLDASKMKRLLQRSVTLDYHKKIYREVTGTDIGEKENWYEDYFELFLTHPEVPIVVRGGERIGNLPGRELSIYLRIGELWENHLTQVETFFRYYQRYNYLIGHPQIASIMGFTSLRSPTADVIARTVDNQNESLWLRTKDTPLLEFYKLIREPWASYHPLSVNMEEDPHRIAILKPPSEAILPVQYLPLPIDHFETRIKIDNPFALTIDIEIEDPGTISVDPTSFSATDQIIKLKIIPNVAPEIKETILTLFNGSDNNIKLRPTFFEFRTIPVTFHILSDDNLLHESLMDSTQLEKILRVANEIIGRQTNTYLVPQPSNISLVHPLHFDDDLGDIISMVDAKRVTKQVFEQVSGSEPRKLNIIFVWQAEAPLTELRGVTIPTIQYADPQKSSVIETAYANVIINTNNSYTDLDYAQVIIHETGHWLGITFDYLDHIDTDTSPCTGINKHFHHPPKGCDGGDWKFYANLMKDGGGYFISYDQAMAFNTYANQILP